MQSKYLECDIEALSRATARQIEGAGWELGPERPTDGRPGGPTISLCHYEAQYLIMTSLIAGGIEQLRARFAIQGITFQDACHTLGAVMDELATGQRPLDGRTRNVLICAAAHYLQGTQIYEYAKARHLDQFLVIRQYDSSGGLPMLRPAATERPGPLTPKEVSEFVVRVLKRDRAVYPERFRRGQPIQFRPKPL